MSGDNKKHVPTVSSTWLYQFFCALDKIGIDPTDCIVKSGISMKDVRDPHARLPHEPTMNLIEKFAKMAGDEDLGIHVGEDHNPGIHGVFDYVIANSSTMREAAYASMRYHELMHDAIRYRLEVGEEVSRFLIMNPDDLYFPRQAAEFVAAATLVRARASSRLDDSPLETHFTHARPSSTVEHERFFRSKLVFSSEVNALIFNSALLDAPFPDADPLLYSIVDEHAEDVKSEIHSKDDFLSQVQRMISNELKGGDPGQDNTAQRMNMSTRTLRRRLKEMGTSHQQLLDQLRHDLCLRYFSEKELTTDEVAFLLGFSETSSFRRAFKRWTGHSAAAYRKHQMD